MPRRIDPIHDRHDTINRPVAMQVARQLLKTLDLPKEIQILYPGLWEEGIHVGGTVDAQANQDPARFKYAQRFKLEVVERAVEDRVLATAVHRQDNLPIFHDPALGVTLTPITIGSQMEIGITFRAESRAEALRFRDNILNRFAEGRTDYLHEIDYSYIIPYDHLELLQDIHTLREGVAGYGDSFSDYVNAHITERATNLATLIGTERKVAIREKQITTIGHFDFVGTTEPETKDREGKTVNIEFRYTFTYDMVNGVAAQYPLMVHGQLIQDRWYAQPHASGQLVLPERRLRAPSLSRAYFDVVSGQNPDWEKLQFEPTKVPYFDDWSSHYDRPYTETLLQVACGIDPTKTRSLFNMADLSEFDIDPLVLEFLKAEAQWVGDYMNSIVYAVMYENELPMADGNLKLTADLEFHTLEPLDPRKQYHLQLQFVAHLSLLTPAAMERLRKHGKAALLILEWLQLKRRGFAYVPPLLGDRYLSESDALRIGEILDGRPVREIGDMRRPGTMRTVGQYGVVGKRSPY